MATSATLSIVKAFDILNIVCEHKETATLRELAAEADMSVATTHRILTTLKRVGAVRMTVEGKYKLGDKLVDLCVRDIATANQIRLLVADQLEILGREFVGSVRTAILDDTGFLWFVAGFDSGDNQVATSRPVGGSYEAYLHAAGKVLLGGQSQEAITAYLATAPLVAVAKNTIVSAKLLIKELRSVRMGGYAVEKEEFMNGQWTVAVPIKERGDVIAALSLSKRVEKLNGPDICRIAARLQRSADNLSLELDRIPESARSLLASLSKTENYVPLQPNHAYQGRSARSSNG